MASNLRALHGPEYVARFERLHAGTDRRLRALLDRMTLAPDNRLLDVGCGSGLLLSLVARQVQEYVGVDFSPAFIEAAEARQQRLGIANARFVAASVEDFAHSERGRFQVATAFDLSEHVPDAEWLAILRAVRQALALGGRLYLHTPNAGFFLERMKARNLIVRQFPEHVAVRTMAENTALIEQSGFRTTRAEYLAHYNVLRVLHPLSRLPLIGQSLRARLFIEAIAQ